MNKPKPTAEEINQAIEDLTARKLPDPLRREWLSVNEQIAQLEANGGKRTDDNDLMDRLDNILMSDEFIRANSEANNEIMGTMGGLDIEWWLETAPKPTP